MLYRNILKILILFEGSCDKGYKVAADRSSYHPFHVAHDVILQ